MNIIDARSGKKMAIGDKVDYGDGEWIRLIDADVGVFSGEATIDRSYRSGDGRMVLDRVTIPLAVRWMHPSFLFRQVAFIPS